MISFLWSFGFDCRILSRNSDKTTVSSRAAIMFLFYCCWCYCLLFLALWGFSFGGQHRWCFVLLGLACLPHAWRTAWGMSRVMRRSAKLWISLDFVGSFWFVGNLMFEGQKPEDVLSCKCVVLVFPAAPSQSNVREREMKKTECVSKAEQPSIGQTEWKISGIAWSFASCIGGCRVPWPSFAQASVKSIKCLKQTCYSIFQNFPVCDICIEFSHQKIEWKWMKVQIPTSVQICPVQNQLRPTHADALYHMDPHSKYSNFFKKWRQMKAACCKFSWEN